MIEMPDVEPVRRIVALLKANPGPAPVVLELPEGAVRLSDGTEMGQNTQSQIVMLLPGAQITFAK